MSTILAIHKAGLRAYWLVLNCGHRYKWTGYDPPPHVGETIACPEDSAITIEQGDPGDETQEPA